MWASTFIVVSSGRKGPGRASRLKIDRQPGKFTFSGTAIVCSLKLSKDSRYLRVSHNLLIDPQWMLKHQFTEIRSVDNTEKRRRLTDCLRVSLTC